jgi:amidase
MQGVNIASLAADPVTRAQLKPEALYEIEQGARLSAYELSALSALRSEWSQAVQTFFERYDYWNHADRAGLPVSRWRNRWPASIAGTPMRT